MTISFYLKKEGGDHNKTIYVQFYSSPNRLTFATRYKVDKKDWDSGQPKKTNATTKLRSDLIDFEKAATAFINGIIDNQQRQPTKGELKLFMKKAKGQAELVTTGGEVIEVDNRMYLEDLFQQYEDRQFKNISESTRGICTRTMNLVNAFSPNAQVYDINHVWGENFLAHLIEEEGMQNGTANKYVKKLITILNWCHDKDIIREDFTKYLEKAEYQEPEIIVVDQDELFQLETSTHTDGHFVQLSDRLERVRHLFIFACYIGQRFEDVVNVSKHSLMKNDVIRVKQEKTGQVVLIPLLPEAKAVLELFNWELPSISNQNANDYIKEVFAALGITRIIHGVRKQGMGNQTFDLPLSEVIHFHVGRSTFCTTALAAGIPEKQVMQISGHTSQKNFQRYVKFNEKQLTASLMKMSRSARTMKKTA